MERRVDTAPTSFAASPVDLIRGTDGFEWSVENLAVRRKSQTDPASNQVNCLYRSRSQSHWIGLAEGTRPQPIRTEIKTTSRRLLSFRTQLEH